MDGWMDGWIDRSINQSLHRPSWGTGRPTMIPPGILVLTQSLQLHSASLTSASRSWRHVFFGHPLFLFPSWSRNAVEWLAESMTNPSLASLSDLLFDWHLTCALPQPFITDDWWFQVTRRQLQGGFFFRQPLTNLLYALSLSWPLCSCMSQLWKEEQPWHL